MMSGRGLSFGVLLQNAARGIFLALAPRRPGAEVELYRLQRASVRGVRRPISTAVSSDLIPIKPRRVENTSLRRPVSQAPPVFADRASARAYDRALGIIDAEQDLHRGDDNGLSLS